jgi:hypothetical protein
VIVLKSQWKDHVLFVVILMALVIPLGTVIMMGYSEWTSSQNERRWLILGSGWYFVSILKWLWEIFMRLYEQMMYLRVEVQRLNSSSLFSAITNDIEKKSEVAGTKRPGKSMTLCLVYTR